MGFLFRRRDPLEGLLTVRGAARCLRSIGALRRLTAAPDTIPAAWERMEPLLLPDLPDCPPPARADLVRALEDCSAACRNRDVARRIMDVRDSLV